MSEPVATSYVEVYQGPSGAVIDVFLTPEDFSAAKKRKITIPGDAKQQEIGIAAVHVAQTVAPFRSRLGR